MNISEFIKKEGRTLPVFLLVDVSGSMAGEKIETVNVALKEMLSSFRKIENPKGIIELCILTFGNNKVKIEKTLSKLADDETYTFEASGNTPMGMAFEKVYSMIEDYNVVSSRSYTPTIVLISDGQPTDYKSFDMQSIEETLKWTALKNIHSGSRTSKATKLAMGIGQDANYSILKAFVNNNSIPVIKANENRTISKFFEWVTMSISIRSVSANPSIVQMDDTIDFNDNEMEF